MAMKRIARDLQSLQDSPLPGISAQPFKDDLQTWHFNLSGANGEHRDLTVHGVLRFPVRYPSQPPEVRLCTQVPHPNVQPVAAGFTVCMDMLDATSTAPYSGWSSSYCIGSLLLQLQSVLFDERAAVFDRMTIGQALAQAAAYACPCGHRPGYTKPALPTGDMLRNERSLLVTRPLLTLLAPNYEKPLVIDVLKLSAEKQPGNVSSIVTRPQAAAAAVDEDAWIEVPVRSKVSRKKQNEANAEQIVPVASLKPAAWNIKTVAPSPDLSVAQLRNARRAQRRATIRAPDVLALSREGNVSKAQEPKCDDGQASTVASLEDILSIDEDFQTPNTSATALTNNLPRTPPWRLASLTRTPLRLLIEVLTHLAPEDAARLALCGRFFKSLGEDGVLWKYLFSKRYPRSELTAQSMKDWKHCFLLEANYIEADLICFHTKASFQEVVLGIPIDFSVNPRTRRIDYISTTLDYISKDAFDSGLRLSQWNESFKEWLPIHLTREHFHRAQPSLERALVRLSPHWGTSRFSPTMVLEVIPKLMNTMIVLLCDKGLESSDRALDGYFLLWRLLNAAVDLYQLQGEVRKRLEDFRLPANRTKAKIPSMGDFLPLLSVRTSAAWTPSLAWQALAQPILEETFDRNVLWVCRDNPRFARPDSNVLGEGADLARLQATLESSKVSKRLLMFHVHFLDVLKHHTRDLFYGRPPHHLRTAFKGSVRTILAAETWPEFFKICQRSCPGPAKLTDILKQSVKNSRQKCYHTDKTDFSRIQASGVSHILKKGETYQIGSSIQDVRLELGSDSANILCGACLVYEDLTCADVVCYDRSWAYGGAVEHSGDMMENGLSKHIINVKLGKLPACVTRLFFTLCACGCTDLSGFKSPAISMLDGNGKPLCTYSIERAGRAPTVVMAVISRSSGGIWQVTALGVHSRVQCCGNYSQVKRDIAGIRL